MRILTIRKRYGRGHTDRWVRHEVSKDAIAEQEWSPHRQEPVALFKTRPPANSAFLPRREPADSNSQDRITGLDIPSAFFVRPPVQQDSRWSRQETNPPASVPRSRADTVLQKTAAPPRRWKPRWDKCNKITISRSYLTTGVFSSCS